MRKRYRNSISILSDLGGSEKPVVRRLRRHAMPGLSEKLKNFEGKVSYDCDWRINGTEMPG